MPIRTDQRTSPALVGRRRCALIAVVSVAAAMVVVDATVVNLALPAVVAELRMGPGLMQWVHEAYTLVFAALLMSCGQLGDRLGRRRMLLLGALVLALASALAAVADTPTTLLVGRALQGVGAAMVFPMTLSVLNSSFRGRERAVAFAVWGASIGAAAGLGAMLGGWLTTVFSWRAAFVVFVPVGLALAAAIRAAIPETRSSAASAGLDVAGTVLNTLAVGLAVLAVTQVPRWGWWAPGAELRPWPVSPTPFLLAAAVVLGGVLWRRHRDGTGLDRSPLTIPRFRRGVLVAAAVHLGEFGLMFALPFWWQNALGHSAIDTATIVLVPTAAALLAAGSAAALVHRLSPLAVVRAGLVCESVAVGGLASVMSTSTTFATVAAFLGLYGVGLGLASAQLGSLVLESVPEHTSGAGSGTMTTAQQLGAALGVAALGMVLFTTLRADLLDRLAALGLSPDRSAAYTRLIEDTTGGAIDGLASDPSTAAVAEAARVALSGGVAAALSLSALALAAALLATRSLADPETGSRETGSRETGSRKTVSAATVTAAAGQAPAVIAG